MGQYHKWVTSTNGTYTATNKPIPITKQIDGSSAIVTSIDNFSTAPTPSLSGTTSNSPNTPQPTVEGDSHQDNILMWCINLSIRLTVMTSLKVPPTDQDVFQELGIQYRKTRGWSKWFSLYTISDIKFVKVRAPFPISEPSVILTLRSLHPTASNALVLSTVSESPVPPRNNCRVPPTHPTNTSLNRPERCHQSQPGF